MTWKGSYYTYTYYLSPTGLLYKRPETGWYVSKRARTLKLTWQTHIDVYEYQTYISHDEFVSRGSIFAKVSKKKTSNIQYSIGHNIVNLFTRITRIYKNCCHQPDLCLKWFLRIWSILSLIHFIECTYLKKWACSKYVHALVQIIRYNWPPYCCYHERWVRKKCCISFQMDRCTWLLSNFANFFTFCTFCTFWRSQTQVGVDGVTNSLQFLTSFWRGAKHF